MNCSSIALRYYWFKCKMYKFQIGEKQLKSSFGYKMMMCRVRVKVRYAKLSANIKKLYKIQILLLKIHNKGKKQDLVNVVDGGHGPPSVRHPCKLTPPPHTPNNFGKAEGWC